MEIKYNFKKPVAIERITHDGILFSDGSTLKSYHEQNCCENVYADWLANSDWLANEVWLDEEKDTGYDNSENIESLYFEFIKDFGFKLYFVTQDDYYPTHAEKLLTVPCYNEQNGYYSDNLSLTITDTKQHQPLVIYNIPKEDKIN